MMRSPVAPTMTQAAGALPGGLTQAQWDALTTEQKMALIDREATSDAERNRMIAEAVRSGATDVIRILELLIARDQAAAQANATRQAELERQRLALEQAKITAATPPATTTTTPPPAQTPAPMSTGTKVAIAGASVAVLGGLLWWISKRPFRNPIDHDAPERPMDPYPLPAGQSPCSCGHRLGYAIQHAHARR